MLLRFLLCKPDLLLSEDWGYMKYRKHERHETDAAFENACYRSGRKDFSAKDRTFCGLNNP